MRVILLDNIRAVGKVGDIKDVRDGYARNFLLPRNLARVATDGAIKDVEQIKVKKLEAYDLAVQQAKDIAEKLKDATLEISAPANEQGTLFAAVEPSQLAEMLSEKAGARIDASHFQLAEPIKTTGEHQATVELAEDVTLDITVNVERS